jgi:hypothetical protein
MAGGIGLEDLRWWATIPPRSAQEVVKRADLLLATEPSNWPEGLFRDR